MYDRIDDWLVHALSVLDDVRVSLELSDVDLFSNDVRVSFSFSDVDPYRDVVGEQLCFSDGV